MFHCKDKADLHVCSCYLIYSREELAMLGLILVTSWLYEFLPVDACVWYMNPHYQKE